MFSTPSSFPNRLSRISAVLTVILLIPVSQLVGQVQPRPPWTFAHQPIQLVNGAPVLFRITIPEKLTALRGAWLEHQLTFRLSRSCNCWYAIAGVDLSTKPGEYSLELEGTHANGTKVISAYPVSVAEAHYPSTAISVAPQFVEPPKETLSRIEEEQALKKKLFSQTSPESLWSGRFEPPAEAAISGVFGSARVFNGLKRNQHLGTDFRVHAGTPIHASNNGTVALARSLYFEGNCVVVDHGQGLLTIYMHLSEIRVKEGEEVERGQLLGLSGGTGRATAPHLHFALRWQGTYLDPATLLKLTPP